MCSATKRVTILTLVGILAVLSACSRQATESKVAHIEISGGKSASVERFDFTAGGEITLMISSDTDVTVHVHGYEKLITIAAGAEQTVKFPADKLGVYEVETHPGGHLLAKLVIR